MLAHNFHLGHQKMGKQVSGSSKPRFDLYIEIQDSLDYIVRPFSRKIKLITDKCGKHTEPGQKGFPLMVEANLSTK